LGNSSDDNQISIDDILIRGTNSSQTSALAANFTMVPDSVNSHLYWTFNTSIGTNLTYSWNFGDGGVSTLQSPTHTYSTSGNFTVCLIVDNGVNNSTLCHTITVASAANSCMALFNISQDSASVNPNAYTITDLSYGSNLSYLWDFGDTTTSTLQYPTHNYWGIGPYYLCLTVDNGAGCTNTYCDSIYAVDSLHSHLQPIFFTVVNGPQPPTSVGINETNYHDGITISPNPFTSQTTILFSEQQKNTTIKIMNVLGECVLVPPPSLQGGGKGVVVDMTGFSKGIYFVRIEFENKKVVNKKIVVQ
jgi:PKD repeat protein